MLLSTGFQLVVLDLGLPPVRGRASRAAWLRLARSAATHRAAVLASSPYRLSGCAASAVVVASRQRGVWSGRGGAPRLLHGLMTHLTTDRRRGHRPGDSAEATLMLAEAVPPAVSPKSPQTVVPEVSHAEAL
jgi:hypothetical protein